MSAGQPAARDHRARPGDSMSLLNDLVEHSLDDGYYRVTERGPRATPTRRRSLTLGALVLFAIIVTVAAVQTRLQLPETQTERATLIAQIEDQKAEVHAKQQQVDELRDTVATLRGSGPSEATKAQRRAQRTWTGMVPVTGPGVQVVVDDAENIETNPQGRILDRDLQTLVNGLWLAGAEAISINGNRLTTLSSIRGAGEAITVNYNSLSPPYVVNAIGNPETLQARFLETDAGQIWANLRNNFGLGFQMSTKEEMHLPAAPERQSRVRVAEPLQEAS